MIHLNSVNLEYVKGWEVRKFRLGSVGKYWTTPQLMVHLPPDIAYKSSWYIKSTVGVSWRGPIDFYASRVYKQIKVKIVHFDMLDLSSILCTAESKFSYLIGSLITIVFFIILYKYIIYYISTIPSTVCKKIRHLYQYVAFHTNIRW